MTLTRKQVKKKWILAAVIVPMAALIPAEASTQSPPSGPLLLSNAGRRLSTRTPPEQVKGMTGLSSGVAARSARPIAAMDIRKLHALNLVMTTSQCRRAHSSGILREGDEMVSDIFRRFRVKPEDIQGDRRRSGLRRADLRDCGVASNDRVGRSLAPQNTPVNNEPPPTKRNKIFISYSHKDQEWLERLQTMLKPALRGGGISLWDDTRITPGTKWMNEITRALTSTRVAVFLVSGDFLASDFVIEYELSPLLEAAKREEVKILWVYLSHCLYDETELVNYQAAHDIASPLEDLSRAEQNRVLVQICRRISKEAAQS